MEWQGQDITMKGISIAFPGVQALSNVDFTVKTGTIQALIGANGAGKSTLMKVLSGAYSHYTGEIYIANRLQTIRSPIDAQRLGIEIVYQEVDTALVPNLTVAENIMLGFMVYGMQGACLIRWKQFHHEARLVLEQLGIMLDTHKKVVELSLVEKQMVLIARAVREQCKFLILDEPTAPLSHSETQDLFRVVRELAAKGVGIVFISHRLPELLEICSELAVMRDGRMISRLDLAPTVTQKQIVELMLGSTFEETFAKQPIEKGSPLLQVCDLCDRQGLVQDISLVVHKGEIVGVAGLVGAGKSELCKTLFGAMRNSEGTVTINQMQKKISDPHKAVEQGLAFVPEERRKEGILVAESVMTNLTAASLHRYTYLGSILNKKKEQALAEQLVQELGIKTPSIMHKAEYLSGGNQQKVAIGKWLASGAEVYLLDEVTKGVDVAAKHDIFTLIQQLAQVGKGVLYASCEFAELLAITDRIYVMYDGKICKELVTTQTNEEELLYYATGGI